MSGLPCEIVDCPRCDEHGLCDLSKQPKEEYYREPKNCSHRLWRLRKKK
jgi:hypothetical protein